MNESTKSVLESSTLPDKKSADVRAVRQSKGFYRVFTSSGSYLGYLSNSSSIWIWHADQQWVYLNHVQLLAIAKLIRTLGVGDTPELIEV